MYVYYFTLRYNINSTQQRTYMVMLLNRTDIIHKHNKTRYYILFISKKKHYIVFFIINLTKYYRRI